MHGAHLSRLLMATMILAAGMAQAQREDLEGVGAPQDVVISEVFYLGDATQDWVEIQNIGTGTVDVSSWWICSRFIYRQLSALSILAGTDLNLGPGEIVVLATSIDLDNGAADLGLYTVNTFASSTAMVDFVQWGTDTDIGRSDVAADKGIWTEDPINVFDFVPVATGGDSVSYCGANSGGGFLTLSIDFQNQAPTQGAVNGVLCPLLFSDGFESGGTGGWDSSVAGLAPMTVIHQI